MTWHTERGQRVLQGAEAALIRESLGAMLDQVQLDYDCGDEVAPTRYGVVLFDRLGLPARLALLAEVGEALLRETESCPRLTALNESVVAALFENVGQCIEIELDCEHEHSEEMAYHWRRLVRAVFEEESDLEDLPPVDCTDLREWNILLEVLTDRVLWDDDFNDADLFLDAPQSVAASLRESLGINPDYYMAIPPDPREEELPAIRARIRELVNS